MVVSLRLEEMGRLGQSLHTGKTEAMDIQRTMADLNDDLVRLEELWATRRQRLEQGLELQRLNQEGDRIEATLSGHEARLKVQDDGVRRPRESSLLVPGVSSSLLTLRMLVTPSLDGVCRGGK